MNKAYYSRLMLVLGLLAGWLGGCNDVCRQTLTYTIYEPVYMTREELKAAVRQQAPVPLVNPGKIYLKDNYLFINEVGKGIHVYNNANPAAPQQVTFINIPGNHDLAVLGDILYADNAMNLVAFDISDPQNVRAVRQIDNAFPARFSNANGPASAVGYPGVVRWYDPATLVQPDLTRGVIVDWIKRDQKRVSSCDQPSDFQSGWVNWGGNVMFAAADSRSALAVAPPQNGGQPTAGIGGSMARFTISQNHLYTIDETTMRVYDLALPADPAPGSAVNVGWGIETIFPYKDKLFIGSRTGMFIFDAANPAQPTQLSTFSHLQSCDPVVVDDQYAYVTLRSGPTCRNTTLNQLDVVDITDLRNPRLVKTYPMQNPHGLGKDGNTLFVCEGEAGLKVFDAADVRAIDQNRLGTQAIHSYDVIPFRNVAIVVGNDGLYQYDYSDPKNLKLLSKIAVTQVKQ
ncbi:MAG: hypothetical protein AVDCRST_MAG56-4649 [uncultured Cytophagales bacterium]|uniref:LVIVD repeat-containing protein n=1 Tax=uncultured Cytophagales bacterium TaxID=158755 RepID=A0A6J4JZN9_9SPHI|nr:MAG: hypothetical protein AVDCRST_MAG56-4649 [uncultured Cytophagales bacterium]